MAKRKKKKALRPVLVTTAHRGVFFGFLWKRTARTVHLKRARNCLYWPSGQRGFLGLAHAGPLLGARVGPPADIELRDVTCIAECTRVAARAWELGPWQE